MADYERMLLSKVINTRDMVGLNEARVDERHFVDEEHLRTLKWMREHWLRHSSSPSRQALKAEYPNYELVDTPEPLSYYVDRVLHQFKTNTAAHGIQDVVDLLEEDVDEAIKAMSALVSDLQVTTSTLRDFDLSDPENIRKAIERYKENAKHPGALRGYATGWPTIDMATMGLQGGQLITFVGPPKAGKSTVLLSCANNVHEEEDVDVLFVSFEMSYEEQRARWFGIRGHLNYRRLLKGTMNEKDERRLAAIQRTVDRDELAKFVISEDISSTTTVSGVMAKVQLHRPQVVFIDGVYLMDDDHGEAKGSPQAITNITRDLKRLAQVHNIPVVITTQTLYSKMRGQNIKASSIGYSSSFGQDSDTVIAVEPRQEDDGNESEHWLKVLLSRSGPQVETQIDFDWSTSTFTEFASEWSSADDPDDEDPGE